jgi:alpha-beta hydrolase superfamily lysophospholipase
MYMFFKNNIDWNIKINGIISESFAGGGSYGEVMKIVERLDPKDGASWEREFLAAADKVRDLAKQAEDQGLHQLARDRYMRASNYYVTALTFMHRKDLDWELDIYKRSVECFHKGIEDVPNIEPVRIPFENSYLSGYFFNASRHNEKTPAVVMFDGTEGPAEKMFFMLGAKCPKYGFSALCMDGPGNGGAARISRMYSRYDSEAVAKALFDYLETRTEVDRQRVALVSPSLGGYFGPRAVAFEKRYAACVAYGSIFDLNELVMKSFPTMPPHFKAHFMWYMGVDNDQALLKKVKDYTLRDIAYLIECPTLIVHGENDHLVPVSQAHKTYEALGCPKKLTIFTREDGGEQHCQQDNLTLVQEEVFCWLMTTFGMAKRA